jgi:hypothetical protein
MAPSELPNSRRQASIGWPEGDALSGYPTSNAPERTEEYDGFEYGGFSVCVAAQIITYAVTTLLLYDPPRNAVFI